MIVFQIRNSHLRVWGRGCERGKAGKRAGGLGEGTVLDQHVNVHDHVHVVMFMCI